MADALWGRPDGHCCAGRRLGDGGRDAHDLGLFARGLAAANLTQTSPQTRVLGVRVDCVDMPAALERIERLVEGGGPHQVATVNPEFVMRARNDAAFARVLEGADLCLPAGLAAVGPRPRRACDLPGPVR